MFISNNIGIIADDLTGADDTALQFHLRGANTQILLDYSVLPENKVNTQVWAIPTETRNSDAPSAYEKVKLAHNDFNASLFGNVNKTPSAKAEADRKKLAEQRIAEAKATVAKARENAKAWREAKLEEYRKNRIK